MKLDRAEVLKPSETAISRIMLTADQTNGRYSIVDEIFKPGMKTPAHRHAYHSETFIMITGQMKWTVAGESDMIGPGDLVYIPPDTSHMAEVVGDENVHAIMLYEPGGYEIGLRLRDQARRKGKEGGAAGRGQNPYVDFIPDEPDGQ